MSSGVRQRKGNKGGKGSKPAGGGGGGGGAAAAAARPSPWTSLSEACHTMLDEVPAHSIAFARIFWGFVMAWEIYSYSRNDFAKTYHQLVRPNFMFHYYDIWVPRLSFETWKVFMRVMLALAFCSSAGLFYHVTQLAFAAGFTFLFLQDMSFYLNHFYLTAVMCWAYTFVPCNRFFSLDAAFGLVKPKKTVPYWALFLTQALVSVVYFHAGHAKWNEDWLLRAEPLAHWLPRRSAKFPDFAWFFDSKLTAYGMSWSGMLFDTFVSIMMFPPLPIPYIKALGFVSSFLFHGMNKIIFNIGIFPWLMSTVTTLYFRPDWPRVVYRYLFTRHPKPARRDDDYLVRHDRKKGFTVKEILTLALFFTFLSHQTFFPLRHYFYAGRTVWNEEGHLGSWRMKLRDKAGMTKYYLKYPDLATGDMVTEMLEPRKLLTSGQTKKMAGRPHMIHLFAHYVADKMEVALNGTRPAVHAVSIGSVNYRPPQWFIDPRVDLAAIPKWSWVHEWVIDLVDLGVTDHPAFVTGGKPTGGDTSKNRLFTAYGHLEYDEAVEKFSAAMKAFGRE